jgi:hypothetical protein
LGRSIATSMLRICQQQWPEYSRPLSTLTAARLVVHQFPETRTSRTNTCLLTLKLPCAFFPHYWHLLFLGRDRQRDCQWQENTTKLGRLNILSNRSGTYTPGFYFDEINNGIGCTIEFCAIGAACLPMPPRPGGYREFEGILGNQCRRARPFASV